MATKIRAVSNAQSRDKTITEMCWMFMEGMTRGETLRSSCHEAFRMAQNWEQQRIKEEKCTHTKSSWKADMSSGTCANCGSTLYHE